jgi:osmoprotectant transport system ATP-binding protein
MIRLEDVTKRYPDGTVAVGDLTMDVRRGELVALVGPSGSGKSTTLRMVNRLVEPTSGRIFLDGQEVTHVDPVQLRRTVGYVIQRVGLFPHLTVADNVATVPRLLGWDRARTRARTAELLELVGLEPGTYGRRYPHELSGGQQQRVGVARALAADPPVLLMDEPFGAVDPLQRERLQTQFRRIHTELGTTVLFVTHDIDEAVRLADRVAVFGQGGALLQLADPPTVLAAPADDAVADFVGADRGIRRMSVTPVEVRDLEQPATVVLPEGTTRLDRPGDGVTVVLDEEGRPRGLAGTDGLVHPAPVVLEAGSSLRDGFAALASIDTTWLPVVHRGRYVGALTPDAVHAALRRTLLESLTGESPANEPGSPAA